MCLRLPFRSPISPEKGRPYGDVEPHGAFALSVHIPPVTGLSNESWDPAEGRARQESVHATIGGILIVTPASTEQIVAIGQKIARQPRASLRQKALFKWTIVRKPPKKTGGEELFTTL
jgi:hypothetical protein